MFLMVQVQHLSLGLILTLQLDLISFKARALKNLGAGQQVPRTQHGWLRKHYSETIQNRKNDISEAIQKFNRSRGQPLDTPVFTNATQYARCLSQVEVNEANSVVYCGANNSVWRKKLRR